MIDGESPGLGDTEEEVSYDERSDDSDPRDAILAPAVASTVRVLV